jgi:hypothetical protein
MMLRTPWEKKFLVHLAIIKLFSIKVDFFFSNSSISIAKVEKRKKKRKKKLHQEDARIIIIIKVLLR